MSTDRDMTRIVRSWLRTDEHESADRVLDDVLLLLDATPQRRAWWPARRFREMNNALKLAVAAGAVVVVAIVGMNLLPRSGGVGGPAQTVAPTPRPTPSPSASSSRSPAPSPTPSASIQRLGDGPLQAGPVLATGLGPSAATSATFTVPEGWRGFAGSCVLPLTGTEAPDGMGICFGGGSTGLFSDPCHGTSGPSDIQVGPTVNDLAIALGAQKAYTSSKPTDVTLGGYSGKQMNLPLPSDVASCDKGEFIPWAGSIYAQGPDNRWQLWILDVDGDRLIIAATSFPATPAADLAEQQAIVDSIQLKP
jgi:hypothetical protein